MLLRCNCWRFFIYSGWLNHRMCGFACRNFDRWFIREFLFFFFIQQFNGRLKKCVRLLSLFWHGELYTALRTTLFIFKTEIATLRAFKHDWLLYLYLPWFCLLRFF